MAAKDQQSARASSRDGAGSRHLILEAGQPGKYRPLGIPTIYERVCQQALRNRLETIFEPVLDDANYGYRRGRFTHEALRKIKGRAERRAGTDCRRGFEGLLGRIVKLHPGSCGLAEQALPMVHDFDPQDLFPSCSDMNRVQLAAARQSGWMEDLHLHAADHARHTKRAAVRRPPPFSVRRTGVRLSYRPDPCPVSAIASPRRRRRPCGRWC